MATIYVHYLFTLFLVNEIKLIMGIQSCNVLFIGNPGVGKSALLNALIGKPQFKSGVNIGKGISYKLDQYKINYINYMDTPGLKDVEMRQSAAKAITKALQTGGFYHVAFVVTLESGRVKPEDAATIKIILESVPEITKFALIVNKLSKRLYNDISSNGRYKTQIANDLVGENISKMHHLFPLQKLPELDDGENVVVALPELKEFILNTLPAISVHKENVKDISNSVLSGYDQQLKIEMENKKRQIEKEQRDAERIRKEAEEARKKEKERLRIQREQEQIRIREQQRQAELERQRREQEIRENNARIERERQEAERRRLEQERIAREEQERRQREIEEQQRRHQAELEAARRHNRRRRRRRFLGIF